MIGPPAGERAIAASRQMPREKRLRKRSEFSTVYEGGRSWANRWVVMRALPSGLPSSRSGFSVSRRLGNAVARNRVKRRLREVVRLSSIVSGWDMVFIARGQAAQADYQTLRKAVQDLLGRASLLGERGQSRPAKADRRK